jgi:hypothetical protein
MNKYKNNEEESVYSAVRTEGIEQIRFVYSVRTLFWGGISAKFLSLANISLGAA